VDINSSTWFNAYFRQMSLTPPGSANATTPEFRVSQSKCAEEHSADPFSAVPLSERLQTLQACEDVDNGRPGTRGALFVRVINSR